MKNLEIQTVTIDGVQLDLSAIVPASSLEKDLYEIAYTFLPESEAHIISFTYRSTISESRSAGLFRAFDPDPTIKEHSLEHAQFITNLEPNKAR